VEKPRSETRVQGETKIRTEHAKGLGLGFSPNKENVDLKQKEVIHRKKTGVNGGLPNITLPVLPSAELLRSEGVLTIETKKKGRKKGGRVRNGSDEGRYSLEARRA